MASLTITEKGYNYLSSDGSILPAVLRQALEDSQRVSQP